MNFWDRDKFDDFVAKAIIGLYEDDNIWLSLRPPKDQCVKKVAIPTQADIYRARNFGPYFPTKDRLMIDGGVVDLLNDDLPQMASFAVDGQIGRNKSEDNEAAGYLKMGFARRINRLPRQLRPTCFNPVAHYEVLIWIPSDQHEKGSFMTKIWGSINQQGKIFNADTPETCATQKDAITAILLLSAILQFYNDSKYLWNVAAVEQEARATFGVYEDEVKSLFYSRTLPVTMTGRKRPILHWVAAHRRRIKEGIDIDIEKYLRGISEFEMNGTMFRITRPQRRCEMNIAQQQAA